jgi:hypothetical protein
MLEAILEATVSKKLLVNLKHKNLFLKILHLQKIRITINGMSLMIQ